MMAAPLVSGESVTGVAGYIPSHIVQQLLVRGDTRVRGTVHKLRQRKEGDSTAGNGPRSYLPSGARRSRRAHRPRVVKAGSQRLYARVR